MEIQFVDITDKGGRKENQDSYGHIKLDNGAMLFVIADGLGGHTGGKIASRLAVDSILNYAKNNFQFSKEGLITLQQTAQELLLEHQENNPSIRDMRTTLVILAVDEDKALWLHCGDSRLYMFRDKKIIACTTDHSVASVLNVTGEIEYDEIRHHNDRNLLLRCLGGNGAETRYSVSKEITELQEDDRFLLCTDGFWEFVHEQEMISLWDDDLVLWLESMRKQVLEQTEDENDNYTACAIHVGKVKKL